MQQESRRRTGIARWLFVVALLLILFGRLLGGAQQLSFTADEPSHIASGYAYLARGATWTVDLRGHPLLLDAWLALPFYLGQPDIPLETLSGWEQDNTRYVQAFVPYIRENVRRTEIATRVPVMLLTVLLAAVVVRWARDLTSPLPSVLGGVGALLALSFDPTLLAHGMLATNDVGTTALGTLGLWLTYRLVSHPTYRRAGIAGAVLGMTMLSKGSGVIWLAGAGAMIGLAMVRDGLTARKIGRWSLQGLTVAATALLITWAFYGFETGGLAATGGTLPMPAPTHVRAIVGQSEGAGERWTYFLGEVRRGGDWRYFPVAALLKNPPALLILAAGGLTAAVVRSRSSRRSTGGVGRGFCRDLCLAAFPLLYTAVAVWSGVNIGYRHLIPVHPFLYLAVAALPWGRRMTGARAGRARTHQARTLAWKIPILMVLVWLGVESLVTGPLYISYFTPFVGGPKQGWRYLADSNTDWGQGYKALAAWQKAGDEQVPFSGPVGYIGMRTYDVDYRPLPPIPANPEPILKPWLYPAPGTYVISANSLSGLGLIAPDNYAWFRYHLDDPAFAGVIADALYIYQVTPLPEQTWLAQCSTPLIPLDAETVMKGFPAEPSRQFSFDCMQSWVYPAGEGAMGWYAVHAENLLAGAQTVERLGLQNPRPAVSFTARRTRALDLSYLQWDYRETPAFALWEQAGPSPAPSPGIQAVYVADAGTPPAALAVQATAPQPLDGPLTFLGVDVYREGPNLEVETWWRVTESGITRPASIMAHLLDESGRALAVADGLGVPTHLLQPGDVIVQSHVFAASDVAGEAWLRTGAYWLDDGARWSVTDAPGDAIFAALGEVGD